MSVEVKTRKILLSHRQMFHVKQFHEAVNCFMKFLTCMPLFRRISQLRNILMSSTPMFLCSARFSP